MQRQGQAGRLNWASTTLRPSQMSDPNFGRGRVGAQKSTKWHLHSQHPKLPRGTILRWSLHPIDDTEGPPASNKQRDVYTSYNQNQENKTQTHHVMLPQSLQVYVPLHICHMSHPANMPPPELKPILNQALPYIYNSQLKQSLRT